MKMDDRGWEKKKKQKHLRVGAIGIGSCSTVTVNLICLYTGARKYVSLLEAGGLLQGWELTPTLSNNTKTSKH